MQSTSNRGRNCNMKKAEIIERVCAGEILVGAEWRSCAAKETEIEDEVTKEKRVTKAIVHQVEIKEMPYEIKEEISKERISGFNCEAFNQLPKPFKKGAPVVIVVKSFGWSQFKKRYSGRGIPFAVE